MSKPFIESEHKRDERGRFAEMETSVLKQRQAINLDNTDEVISGAKSGALDPSSERAVAHAEKMYETFRNVNTDVPKVAKITGCTEQQIRDIKKHVFENPEFTPDFDQAQTWLRLRDGKPIEADFIFIKHELMEIELMGKGMTQQQAHKETNKHFHYANAIKELYKNGSIKEKKGK